MFVDSHAHLDSPDFELDLHLVLERARQAGVTRILAVGSGAGPGSLDGAVKLAERSSDLDASVGIHPHEAKLAATQDFVFLEELAHHPRVVAWGEIGLDFHYHHSPRQVQEEVFVRQLNLAKANRLPVIIHTREAEAETLALLRQHWGGSGLPGILHCFSGSWQLAQECLEMGFLISFSGILTFPKAGGLREVALRVPVERLLIETDCPYLAPVPHRGRRNEPAWVVETARVLAEIKGLSLKEVGRITSANYQRFCNGKSVGGATKDGFA